MNTRRFVRNISSNAAGYVVNVIIAFFLSPFLVHRLGDQMFGVWTLVVSVNGYYGLLDLGIRSAVGQYATRYYAKGDTESVNRTLSTALACMIAAAVLVFVVATVIALNASSWFNLTGREARLARMAILITGFGLGINLPMALFGVATYARQRFDVANGIAISITLLSKAAIVVFLLNGYGILALAAVTVGTNVVWGAARVFVSFRLLPGLVLAPRFVSRTSLRELSGYGVFNFMVNIADRIITHLDAIVIGIFMTTTAVTYYAIGANLIPYYISIINSIAFTLTPYATSCDAKGDREALRRLWIHGTRGILTLAAVVAAGMFFLGGDFLRLWMGERFVEGAAYTPSSVILQVLTIAALVRLGMTCGKQVCFGIREVRFLAYLTFGEAVCNVVLSVTLVRWFGLVGVAVGTLCPILIAYLIVEPAFLMKKLRVAPLQFYGRVAWGAMAAFGAMWAANLLVGQLLDASTWGRLIFKGSVMLVPSALAGGIVGTTAEERRWITRKLISGLGAGPRVRVLMQKLDTRGEKKMAKKTVVVQSLVMACCIGAVVLWALNFPYPSPVVRPFLSPKLRWPEGQIREWATTGDFDADYWRYFTRDPQRTIPAGPNIVAPADGLLRYIDHKDGWTYVVIAMSFWDVHVQRSPCAATVLSMEDAGDTFMDGEGKDLVYLREKVCPVQKVLHLDTEWGPFVLRLITSVSARRLETWVSPGEKLKKGQRLGRILAGSTVVLEMPDSLQLDVSVGERLVAGESILYSSAEAQ